MRDTIKIVPLCRDNEIISKKIVSFKRDLAILTAGSQQKNSLT